jgi:hypothetical protein
MSAHGFDNPLHFCQRRVESRLQGGQGDVHDGAVDERQARSENGGRQYPPAPAGLRPTMADAGQNRGFISTEVWQ